MRLGRFFRTCGALVLFGAPSVVAQQPEPKAAPKTEPTVPSTVRSFIVADKRTDIKDPLNRTNKLHCLVCENNLNPVVAVFARTVPAPGADEPLTKLTTELKKLLADEKNKAQNFGSFIVFVALDKEFQADDKRDIVAANVKTWGEAVGSGPIVLGLTGQTGEAVKSWNLNKEDDITVVLYHRMKLVQVPWKFEAGKMADADIKAIIAATQAELGKK